MKDLSEIEQEQVNQIIEAVNSTIREINVSDGIVMLAMTQLIAAVFIATTVGEAIDKGQDARELWRDNALQLTEFFAHVIADTRVRIEKIVEEADSEETTVH
jgi:hypothetical protein